MYEFLKYKLFVKYGQGTGKKKFLNSGNVFVKKETEDEAFQAKIMEMATGMVEKEKIARDLIKQNVLNPKNVNINNNPML